MLDNITFQQIEAFLTIAKYNSISKACDALYISQPALSKIIKRFEDNLGTPLFVRSNQGVVLTAIGKYLYFKITPLYKELDQTFQSVETFLGPEDKSLHIVLPTIFDYCDAFAPIKEKIRRFKSLYPDVRVTETVLDLERLQHTINIGFSDIVIAPDYSLPEINTDLYKTSCVSEIKQYVTMSANCPLAKQKHFDYSALNSENFLCVPYGSGSYSKELLFNLCHQNGFSPARIEYPPNYHTLLHSISNGISMSITWRFSGDSVSDKFVYFPLESVTPPLHAVIAWRPDRITRAANEFLSL